MISETTPTPPVILACAPNQTVSANTNCLALVPDLGSLVVVTDNCCCVTFTQVPAVGTPLLLGTHPVTIVATDTAGLSATCMVMVTVVDATGPSLTCPSALTMSDTYSNAALPNLTGLATASDACSPPVTLTQIPPAGTVVPLGVTNVTLIATDAANNSTTCQVRVTVVAAIRISSGGGGALSLSWPANMPPVVIQFATNLVPPVAWADLVPQPTPVPQPDGSLTVPLPVTLAPDMFYRVRLP